MSKQNESNNEGPGGRYYTKPCYLVVIEDAKGHVDSCFLKEVRRYKPLKAHGRLLEFDTKREAKEVKRYIDESLDRIYSVYETIEELFEKIDTLDKQLKEDLRDKFSEAFVGSFTPEDPITIQSEQPSHKDMSEMLNQLLTGLSKEIKDMSNQVLPQEAQTEPR